MKIVLDRQTTEISIKKNAESADIANYYWNATFTTDFKADGNVQEFTRLVCAFLNNYSDRIKTGDKATNARIIADSRTENFSFTIELIEMTDLKMVEIN